MNSINKPINKILIGHEYPKNIKNPYSILEKKYNLKVDFKPLIRLEELYIDKYKDQYIFAKYEFTAIIFTSKISIDFFFKKCSKLKYCVDINMKYFCTTESIALYLKKYIQYKKRKVFFAKNSYNDFLNIIDKNHEEIFLYPCSNICNNRIFNSIIKKGCIIKKIIIYQNLYNDLSDMKCYFYDIIAVFTPLSIKSLINNFPDLKNKNIKIAAFGDKTHEAVINAGLSLDIKAPTKFLPSMIMALELYIKNINLNKKC